MVVLLGIHFGAGDHSVQDAPWPILLAEDDGSEVQGALWCSLRVFSEEISLGSCGVKQGRLVAWGSVQFLRRDQHSHHLSSMQLPKKHLFAWTGHVTCLTPLTTTLSASPDFDAV